MSLLRVVLGHVSEAFAACCGDVTMRLGGAMSTRSFVADERARAVAAHAPAG